MLFIIKPFRLRHSFRFIFNIFIFVQMMSGMFIQSFHCFCTNAEHIENTATVFDIHITHYKYTQMNLELCESALSLFKSNSILVMFGISSVANKIQITHLLDGIQIKR